MTPIRADLTPPPSRIAALPVSDSGYPVPWFVAWVNGKPEFRCFDSRKMVAAVNRKLCWVCGEPLGRNYTFTVGPMCCVNRTSAEPPSHIECARWSAINCPFLNGRKQQRREDESLAEIAGPEVGVMIRRQPNAVALWSCRDYRAWSPDGCGLLFQFGDYTSIEWFSHGRAATREEIELSVCTGLPTLEAAAKEDGEEGLAMLQRAVDRFWKLPMPIAGGAA